MNKNLDIFVFAHKQPKVFPKNDVYKLVSLKPIEGHESIVCGDLPLEHAYSEGARIKFLWKNQEFKDYVGTAHYRRYFNFFENVPDVNSIFQTHDAILPSFNLGADSLYLQYASCHNIKDLDLCLSIICEKFPEYFESARDTINGKDFIPCNIFILPKETFYEWCAFVFGVLNEYDKTMNFTSDLDVYNYVSNNINLYCEGKGGINSTTQYQSRIQSFLLERLSTIFFKKNITNPLYLPMVLTEGHDGWENINYEKL